jgi:hypothetical protein
MSTRALLLLGLIVVGTVPVVRAQRDRAALHIEDLRI